MVIAIAILLVLVFIAVVIAVTQYDRYRPRVRHEFTMPTTEVHVDPVTGVRQRVYVNPATGERAFVDEPVERLTTRILEELHIRADLTSGDAPQAGRKVATDAAAAHCETEGRSQDLPDPVAGDVLGGDDDHG